MQRVSYDVCRSPEEVEQVLAGVRSEPEVALDLEADSLHSYREKVCLIQLSTGGRNAIVDPLAREVSLAGLGALLSDSRVRKVFHGGDYDIRLLKKDYGLGVRNLFDTMIAAQFTGRTRFGLAALLEEHFGVTLDKKYQRADWSTRPLKRELLDYAALDTAYLLPLKSRLEAELQDLGRLPWVQEEFARLEEVEPTPDKAPWCLDVKGAARLSPPQLAVLQKLVELRDHAAREWDRPPFKVFSNDVLLRWASEPPQTRQEVEASRGASQRTLAKLSEQVLEAVRTGASAPQDTWPRPRSRRGEPMTHQEEKLLTRLKKARAGASERFRLPPGLLINNATLERIARSDPDEVQATLETQLKSWQKGVLGEDLVAAVKP